tara:strand:- start:8223 stop:9077 length:855 start_codon:yes stop_codon:yes gene_type:complete
MSTLHSKNGSNRGSDTPIGIDEPTEYIKHRSHKRTLRRAASLFAVIGFWWVLSLFLSDMVLPGPFLVGQALFGNLMDGDTYFQLYITMVRVLGGMAIAMVFGTIAGLVMGLSNLGEDLLINWILIGFSIPAVVFGILSILWFGLTDLAAILAVGTAATPAIAINIWQGAKAIDDDLVHMGKAFHFSRKSLLRLIIVPQLIPYILAALRYALAISWKIVTVVELIGLSSGVGYMLHWWFGNFSMTQVLAWTLLFTITLLLIENFILKPVEKHLTRWRPRTQNQEA